MAHANSKEMATHTAQDGLIRDAPSRYGITPQKTPKPTRKRACQLWKIDFSFEDQPSVVIPKFNPISIARQSLQQ